jgi:hypothetical protein
MNDITTGGTQVIETRQKMHKNFDIDVTVCEQTHNFEIDVFHTEDVDGGDAELESIKVGKHSFDIEVGTDAGLSLSGHLGTWFDENYAEFMVEETQKDFDEIFAAVWEYIELKNLQ